MGIDYKPKNVVHFVIPDNT